MKLRILIMTLFLTVSTNLLADDSVGIVLSVKGEVTASGSAAGERGLARGDKFYNSDTIATGSGATAALRFLDGSIIDLMGLSQFKINEYKFSEDNPAEDNFSSELLKGGFRGISGTIGERNPSKVNVRAQMTTLTIRGTEWKQITGICGVTGGIVQCSRMLFEIEDGEVTVTNLTTGEVVTLDATEQMHGLIVDGDDMTLVESITDALIDEYAGMEYATDQPTELEGDATEGSDPCGALNLM